MNHQATHSGRLILFGDMCLKPYTSFPFVEMDENR